MGNTNPNLLDLLIAMNAVVIIAGLVTTLLVFKQMFHKEADDKQLENDRKHQTVLSRTQNCQSTAIRADKQLGKHLS